MTRLAVAIMVETLGQALAAAQQAQQQRADLVEFRVDRWAALTPDRLDELTRLLRDSALPAIVTCRSPQEGGQYDGDEQTRISFLEHAALAPRPAAFIDLELASYRRSASIRQKIDRVVDHPGQPRAARLILSSHDFAARPPDLPARVQALEATPAAGVAKIVWQAADLNDNLAAFDILARARKPTIALCMGEHGLPSRILAPKFGGFLTFAALSAEGRTAPGQPTADQLRRLYRFDRVGPATRVYGVIGHPVGHSLSPHIHNAGFDAVGFDGVYLLLPIQPTYEDFARIVGAWLDCPGVHFRGASVTIPHKENLLRFVRERGGEVEPLAQRIGAANTLAVRDDGSLYASNTDYAAALDAVCGGLGIARPELRGLRVAVLGAGGVARAVVAGFAQGGAAVVIYNRTADKAQRLAAEFGGPGARVVAAPLARLCDSCCQVYVNCTPLGMHPQVDATPLAEAQRPRSWGGQTLVFDTIYNPIRTRLLREAAAAGCRTVPGFEMFVRQAVAQFELWTGRPAPVERFRDVVLEGLQAQA